MSAKYYFVIYPHDERIKEILDGMKVVADPTQKNRSHITVKGPYLRKEKKKLKEDNKLIVGKEIKINGVGNFFIENQNTVYLQCEERNDLYDIWRTKTDRTYKEFHPHITIYDGKNRSFADKIYGVIVSHKISVSFLVDKLDLYSSKDKEKIFSFPSPSEVNYDLLSEIAEFIVNPDVVRKLNDSQRVDLIDKLCYRLSEIENSGQEQLSFLSSNQGKEDRFVVEA